MKDDKELTNLEVCNRIAKLTKQNYQIINNEIKVCPANGILRGYSSFYNPITDNALNLELRDEYQVEIDYFRGRVIIYNHDTGQTWAVYYADKSGVNRAVLECILESVK